MTSARAFAAPVVDGINVQSGGTSTSQIPLRWGISSTGWSFVYEWIGRHQSALDPEGVRARPLRRERDSWWCTSRMNDGVLGVVVRLHLTPGTIVRS